MNTANNNLSALQEKYQLSPLENEIIFKGYILPGINQIDAQPMPKPRADLLGGQPGSGKSSLMHLVIKGMENKNLAIPIASDDYRHFHPKYQQLINEHPELASMIVTPDADIWTDKMLNECMARRLNIAIEGTMGKTSWAVGKENRLKQNGYEIQYRIMAVKPTLSKISTFNRYAEMLKTGAFPRFVTTGAHDERFDGLKQTIEMLSKQNNVKLSLYTREINSDVKGNIIDNLKILKADPVNPILDFKNQTTASLTLPELNYIRKSIEILKRSGISKSLLSEAFPRFMNDNGRKFKL